MNIENSKTLKKLEKLNLRQAESYASTRKGEQFSDIYKRDKESFRLMMVSQIELERQLRKFFKDQTDNILNQVNWSLYERARFEKSIQASEWINLLGDAILILGIGGILYESMKWVFMGGVKSGEDEIKIDSSWNESSAAIVGGLSMYSRKQAKIINEGTQSIIDSLIAKGISQNWSREKLEEEIKKALQNTKRFENIADVETIVAFNLGKRLYTDYIKKKSQATMEKRWRSVLDSRTCQYCKTSHGLGWVDYDYIYNSPFGGITQPPSHSRCRCGTEYRIKQI